MCTVNPSEGVNLSKTVEGGRITAHNFDNEIFDRRSSSIRFGDEIQTVDRMVAPRWVMFWPRIRRAAASFSVPMAVF